MKLICLGSSSRGNGYILQGKSQTLLLEAGVPLSQARKYISDWSQVVGCLVTHRHGDHSKYIKEVMRAGIKVYANGDVLDHCSANINGEAVEHLDSFTIGDFVVVPMEAEHDVPCVSFLIYHVEMGKLVFATDTADLPYTFEGVRHVLIECNWSEECMQKAIDEGRTNQFVANRSRETHMGLDMALSVITNNIAPDSNIQDVVLLHLSHENSDPNTFQHIVSERLNKPVYIAQHGLVLELS